jgi:hypothetical protein
VLTRLSIGASLRQRQWINSNARHGRTKERRATYCKIMVELHQGRRRKACLDQEVEVYDIDDRTKAIRLMNEKVILSGRRRSVTLRSYEGELKARIRELRRWEQCCRLEVDRLIQRRARMEGHRKREEMRVARLQTLRPRCLRIK